MAPAIVFDPFPAKFAAGSGGGAGAGGGGGGGDGGGGGTCSGSETALVIEFFGGDEDEGLLDGPVALAVFSWG